MREGRGVQPRPSCFFATLNAPKSYKSLTMVAGSTLDVHKP